MKRLFDIVVSAAGLLATAPIWLAVIVSIKAEDGGPVLFVQRRVGRGGRAFTAYKFRSMVPDAAAAPTVQAEVDDPRVTRVGRWLRATALDELPQLVNILRGDMSVVGPRPLAEGEVEVGGGGFVRLESVPGYQRRHVVRPGLTGLAQVFARRDLPRRQKFRLDALYVERGGFCLDLRLILLSFWITFRGRWETRGPKV